MGQASKKARKAAAKLAGAKNQKDGGAPRVTVVSEWARLFRENAERAKSGSKRPRTDAELVEEMGRLFPDRKDSTTITRCSMARGCYNKGTGMFVKLGPGSPQAVRYAPDGTAMADRQRESTVGRDAEKADGKVKAGGKKRSAAKAAAAKAAAATDEDDEG